MGLMETTVSGNKSASYRSILEFVGRRLPGFSALLFSMLISRQMTGFPFYGGVWFLTGQVVYLASEAYYSAYRPIFSNRRRVWYTIAAAFSAACCLLVTFFFHPRMEPDRGWPLLIFVANQLAGVVMLEGSALMPISPRKKLAVNLASFAAVSAAAMLVSKFVWGVSAPWLVMLSDVLFLALLCVKALLESKQPVPPAMESIQQPVDEMEGIYAYRQYRKMASNVLVSIELSIMLLVCYTMTVPENNDWKVLLDTGRLLAVFGVCIWACRVLLKKDRLNALGSNIAFLLFSALWIFVNLYSYSHPGVFSGMAFLLPLVLISFCMAALSAVLLNMDRYMVIIGQVGDAGVGQEQYGLFRNTTYHGGAVVSRVLLLALMAAATAFYGLSSKTDFVMAAVLSRNKLIILPLAFLIAAALSSLHQPMTRYYEQKLSRYLNLKRTGAVSRALENKLILSLVKKNGKRIGIWLVRAAVKPFVTVKRVGVERINPKQFPCVFVCNHAEIFGPVAATVNIPFFNRPWIIHEMIDHEKIAAHLQTGFDHWLWVPPAFRRRLGALFGPVMLWAMQSMDPIPVYRNNIKDITKTIALSTEALEAEDNILIFPENPFTSDGRYVTEGVGEFFEGFVHIARNYCRNTGKPLTFYSVFANAKSRTISFSEGIQYNTEAAFNEERDRICHYLHDEMAKMYEGSSV